MQNKLNNELLDSLLNKEAYVPPAPAPMDPAMMGGGMPAPAPGGMPMDPAAMGGMPMDPAAMGGMPMDPAMMGGMPMDPAMMGGMPMDPAAMGGAMPPPGPMPDQVGQVGAAPVPEEAPAKVGDMSLDDLKMFLAETIMEVNQGQGMAGEAVEAQAATNEELMARIEELEKIVAGQQSDQGIIPSDSPEMELPVEGAFEEIPVEAPVTPMPKVASEEGATLKQRLSKLRQVNLQDPKR